MNKNQIYIFKYINLYIFFTFVVRMNTSYEIEFLEDATEKLKAIAHPIRFLMIEMLYNAKEMSVTDVHEKLDIEQAVASHHLRILKNQNIVKVNRDGKNSFYSLSSEVYFNIIAALIPSS